MRFLRACLILPAAFLVGCRADETIERYDVEHVDREALVLRVAVFEHGDTVWFFRISGPTSAVEERMPEFKDLVESVRFNDNDREKPPISFTDPKGWKKDPKMKMRFASYLLETTSKPIDVKISHLKREQSEWLANIHRWQKELNLPLAEANEMNAFMKRGKVGDHEVTWVEMTGLGVYQIGARKPEAPKRAPKFVPVGGTPFRCEIPLGWEAQPRPNDGITAALFMVTQNDQKAKVTFTSAGGSLADNIKRWRGQIGLPPADPAEAVRNAAKIKAAGAVADYVDLDNPREPSQPSRILAVIVPVGQRVWVIRMSGPREWVGKNKDAFENFAKSLQLDLR